MGKKPIVDYYEYTRRFYKYMWHGDTGGVHYGFWDKNTKNHKEALLNTNKVLAVEASIKKDDYVLDAGCGVGGSAIWLAENIGCKVQGVTITPSQIVKANQSVRNKNLTDKLTFTQQDFLHTNFPNETFDIVWAIESVCHAENKNDFIKEAYRVLKSGGRLVMSDGFLMREPSTNKEKKWLKEFLDGWALLNLVDKDSFQKGLSDIGFKNIKVTNMKEAVLPEARKIRRMTLWGYPLTKITETLRITSPILTKNNLGGLAQYHLIKEDIMNHFVFYAEK